LSTLPSNQLDLFQACQSVLFNFAELLNSLIEILGYRVEDKPDEWSRAINWLSINPALLKKSQAFGILVDCLKESVSKTDHPLDYQANFKCSLSPKEGWFTFVVLIDPFSSAKEQKLNTVKEFEAPDCLIVSLDSMLLHWSKIIFLLDQLDGLTALMRQVQTKQ
jgi:hypothetical protein